MDRRRRTVLPALALVVALTAAACHTPRPGGPGTGHGPPVRLNEVQVLASHNSYHVEPEPTLFSALLGFLGAEAEGFEYTHRPLAEQFDAGVRAIELDVFADDPTGGRYAHPVLGPLLGLAPVDPAFAAPGLKVFHVQEVDYRSTCTQLTDCLGQVRGLVGRASGAPADHDPDRGQGRHHPRPRVGVRDAAPVGPGHVRRARSRDPLRVHGRPRAGPRRRAGTVGQPAGRGPRRALAPSRRRRGQVLFVLDDKGAKRDAYRAEVPDLADRSVFVDVPEGDPDAAITVVNDPLGDADRIRALVEAGFIVRTRADADTVQARSGDTSQRDAALASGAQYVSTDYVWPDDRFGTGYVVDLPGDTAARCNPVSAPSRCERADLAG